MDILKYKFDAEYNEWRKDRGDGIPSEMFPEFDGIIEGHHVSLGVRQGH